MAEFNYEIVKLNDAPKFERKRIWLERLKQIPTGMACKMHFNNHQRAYQVRNSIRQASVYHKIPISTRVIHAEPMIQGQDGWLLYFWKRSE